MRGVVGHVPNSGYMLRFTQKHAYLRINTKPVNMPEDSPQTPQHPPNITHSPERAWGILIKTKEGIDEISTAKRKYQKSSP